MNNDPNKTIPERLFSLDALRGFDMMFIMGGDMMFKGLAVICSLPLISWWAEQMDHVAWDGFAFFDIIFPLFLFIAGVSFPYSSEKSLGKGISKKKLYLKILERGLKLVFFGMIYNGLLYFNFENFRFVSVLGRIGFAWMFAAFIYLNSSKYFRIIWFVGILIGYWLLLALVPAPDANTLQIPEALYGKTSLEVINATGNYSLRGNLAGYIDRLLVPGKMWLEIFDPEGILGIIPATATALLGMFAGLFVKNSKIAKIKKAIYLFLAGVVFLLIGYIWNHVFPINKNLWSSSFVCFAGGLSLALFAVFYLIIDVWQLKRWSFFFRVIGLNSITIYLASVILDIGHTVRFVFGGVISLFPAGWNEMLTGFFYIFICWILLYFLYKQKVFLKV